nr:class I tRNA ligase family protein [Klebsiella variicola]
MQPGALKPVNRLVYFLGFDNSYFWGVTHLALLMAHDGKYILPESIVSNEFYELENAKFSTSRGHLIWARDLVRTLPRDYARFYLCLTSPEHNRSNFSRQALQQILNDRLIASWNTLVSEYNARNWAKYSDDATERTSTTIAAMHSRLELTCRIDTFSQSRLADWILHHITRLQELISGEKDISLNAFNRQLQVLVEGMGLIMIDLHRAITETGITDYNRQWGLPELLPINTFAESESYAS